MSGLCFSAFFRLSGITRVLAGLSPDLRARRRASVPFSSRSFFRFAIPVFYHSAQENDKLLLEESRTPLESRHRTPGGTELFVTPRFTQNVNVSCRSSRRFEVESLNGRWAKPFDSPKSGEPRFPISGSTFTLLKMFRPITPTVSA